MEIKYFKNLSSIVCMASVLMMVGACNKTEENGWTDNGLGGYGASDGCLSLTVLKEGELPENTKWETASSIGVFLTKDTIGNPYEDDDEWYSNIRSEYYSGLWFHRQGEIELTANKAVLYAYMPYMHGVDPHRIPVETETGTQYMYGTHKHGQDYVNRDSTNARLEMKNALAMIDLRIRKNEYTGNAVCTSLEIRCKEDSGNKLPVAGMLDLATGKLEADEFGLYAKRNIQLFLQDDFVAENQILWTAIPYDLGVGEVELVATVNSEVYTVDIDGRKDWQRGYRTVYNVNFTGKHLTLQRVSISPWITHNHNLDIVD